MAFNKTFVNTNGTDLTAHDVKWLVPTGQTTMEVFGNRATGIGGLSGSFDCNYLNETFADKHYAIASFVSNPSDYHGVAIRVQSGANSFYYAIRNITGGVFAGEMIAGTATDWDAGQTGWGATDTVELHVDATTATTIHLKRNGSTIATYTSKSALSGGRAGICAAGVLDGAGISAWEGGDIGAGSSFSLTVDSGSLALEGQNVALVFSDALTLPVTAGQAALEGQEIPFILTQPGTDADMAIEGQSISLLAQSQISVTAGELCLQGQSITTLAALSLTVDAGAMALDGRLIELTATGIASLGDGGGVTFTGRRRRRH